MKIRCASNSVRLRLRKSDLEILRQSGILSDKITFVQEDFVFALAVVPADSAVLEFSSGQLTVSIPSKEAKEWMDTDQVGLSYEIETSPSVFIEVLIEKDFPCKDRDEDQSDTFFELDQSSDAC